MQYLIQYPDSESGKLMWRLCEMQDHRDGDIMVIEKNKFPVDDNDGCYKRLKKDKIQKVFILRELTPQELNLLAGVTVPQTSNKGFSTNDPLDGWDSV